MQELRLYTFINFYLSSIQQGIQTAHIVQELNNKYAFSSEIATLELSRWARDFKTIIVCNGGGAADLKAGIALVRTFAHPWVEFYEEPDCLSGALTGFGVILPARIFDAQRNQVDTGEYFSYHSGVIGTDTEYFHPGDREFELVKYVRSRPLAR